MSEDIKKNDPIDEGGDNTAAEQGAADELNELEQLRDTFQQAYDETVAEAENGPVIQELETDLPDPDDDEPEEEHHTTTKKKKAAPVKKKSIGKKIVLAVVIALAAAIFGLLILYFALSVSNPNFNSLVAGIAKASAAETYEDKMAAYDEALGYCTGESGMQVAMKNAVIDEMLRTAYNEKGFAAAYSLMTNSYSPEDIEKGASKMIKTLKKLAKSVDDIAYGSMDAVIAALKDTDAEAKDIAEKLSVPKALMSDVVAALDNEVAAIKALDSEVSIETASTAAKNISTAYGAFVNMGADEQELAERMSLSLYNNGYVLTAATMEVSFIDPDAEAVNEEFAAMRDEIATIGSFKGSVYTLAEKSANGDDIDKLIADAGLKDAKAAMVRDLITFCKAGIDAEKEKNLTKASGVYANVFGLVQLFGMTDERLTYKTVALMVDAGEFSSLQTYDSYLSDVVVAKLGEEEKANVEKIHSITSALTSASEVFSEYMTSVYYGAGIDYDAACADLDAILTDKSTNYDRGFVAYCKYFAAVYSENDSECAKHVETMQKEMPELKSVYGDYLIALYKKDKKFDEAEAFAKEMLADNIGNDLANSVLAFCKRVKGDINGAAEAALKGYELSGADGYCIVELCIDYMLNDDFDSAFEYIKKVYDNLGSYESCELILICNALYNGKDEGVKAELAELKTAVDSLYENYGAKSYSDTLDIIKGTKTLKDVYLAGEYSLTDNGSADDATPTSAE